MDREDWQPHRLHVAQMRLDEVNEHIAALEQLIVWADINQTSSKTLLETLEVFRRTKAIFDLQRDETLAIWMAVHDTNLLMQRLCKGKPWE